MDDFAGLEQLHSRILNWARWCRESKPKGHCRSIEHRYRSPQWGHWDSTPPAIQGQIDLFDAHLLEDTVRLLHWRQRLIVRLTYIKRWQPGWICSKIGTNRKDYEESLYFALIALENELKLHTGKRIVMRNNSETEPSMLLAA